MKKQIQTVIIVTAYGEDEANTDYCQYVFYPDEENKDNYILAIWSKNDLF